MNTNTTTTTGRLEALRKVVQAAYDTDFSYPSAHTRGITTGLRIALQAIDAELVTARELEAASSTQ